ncbi:MAG: hypothetical protein AAGB12_16210 [Pseudomonadota bacterium]
MSKHKSSRKPKNWQALNPLMNKGGVHEKSNGAKRRKEKLITQKMIDEQPSHQKFH